MPKVGASGLRCARPLRLLCPLLPCATTGWMLLRGGHASHRCLSAGRLISGSGTSSSSATGIIRNLATSSSPPEKNDVDVVDLRSDTVTRPTARMRAAMAEAEVGDDVLGDDPTVASLEARVAELLGKEAALFVPSGSQGNLIAVMAHCWERGSEYVVGDASHMHLYEQGGGAQVAGAHPRQVATLPDGTLPLDAIDAAIRKVDDPHFPTTRFVALENTHNMRGGAPLSARYVNAVKDEICAVHGLALHVDGARLWHAAAALDEPLVALAEPADTLSVCFSKALGAPAGSAFVGDAETVKRRGKRVRKLLGGAMRQVGVLAAAAHVALDDQLPNVGRDHDRARRLHDGLIDIGAPFVVDEDAPPLTNLLYFGIDDHFCPTDPDELTRFCDERGVKFLRIGDRRFRLVTHHQVDDDGVDRTLHALRDAVDHLPSA